MLPNGRIRASFVLALGATLSLAAGAAAAEHAPFRFVLIGDRTGSAVPGVYEEVLAEVNRLAPDLVVTVGDEIEGYTEDPVALTAMWSGYDSLAARLGAPVYLCAGNHDITSDGMVSAWKAGSGREPCYSFDRNGVHFAILDTGRWETSAEWMEKSGYREWMEKDLAAHARDRLTVVVFHKPYWYDTLAERKPDPMHDVFRRNGVDYVFNGHFHDYATAVYDEIRYTILASSGGALEPDEDRASFFQFLWCTVEGDSIRRALIRKDGIVDPDASTVADDKFLDRLATEYVTIAPVETAGNATRLPCVVSVRNATAAPIEAVLRWDVPAGWTVRPAESRSTLGAGAGVSIPFEADAGGAFYPIPVLRMDYPWRPGRTHACAVPLPAIRAYGVERAGGPVVVDGRIGEAAWSAALKMDAFGSPEGTAAVIEPTTLRLAYDRSNLYLSATCEQTAPYVIQAAARDGAVHRDDCVGLFLCPDHSESTFCQIYFNPSGTVFDQKVVVTPTGAKADVSWNGTYEVATARTESGWTLEAAIPFSVLGADPPEPGRTWRANFRRKEISKGSSADWQVPVGYEPAKFGRIVFR